MGAVSVTTKTYEAAGELLKVLSAPARLAIVVELADEPRYVHELVEHAGDEPTAHLPASSSAARRPAGRRRTPWPRSGLLLIDHHVAHIVADAVNHSKET